MAVVVVVVVVVVVEVVVKVQVNDFVFFVMLHILVLREYAGEYPEGLTAAFWFVIFVDTFVQEYLGEYPGLDPSEYLVYLFGSTLCLF